MAKQLSVIAQYVIKNTFQTYQRPYDVKSALRFDVEIFGEAAPLPHADHWRVVATTQVTGSVEGQRAIEGEASVEAIVKTADLGPEELQDSLKKSVGPALVGQLRALLTLSSQQSGFPSLTLPPVDAGTVAAKFNTDAIAAHFELTSEEA